MPVQWPGRFAFIAAAVWADATVGAGAEELENQPPADEIVVVGTRIPRPDARTASPVVTFDRNEFKAFGENALEAFADSLPQVAPDFGKSTNTQLSNGTAAINLRGLGRARTLVLMNGRRLSPTGVGSAFDLNAIPQIMIERMEFVTGGATAVYGSDAVTGAVNFVTRKNFSGLEVNGQFSIYGAGDGEEYDANAGGGFEFADGRGHASIFVDYVNRKPVFGAARKFTSVTISEDRDTGELIPFGSGNIPAGHIIAPISITFDPDGTPRDFTDADAYNFGAENYIQVPMERWSTGLLANFDATDRVNFYTELLYARPNVLRNTAPAAQTFDIDFTIAEPFFPASALAFMTANFDPDMDGIGFARIRKRLPELGRRITATNRNYYRGVVGFTAELSSAWNLDAYYSYAFNKTDRLYLNGASISRTLQGLLFDPTTGQCLDPSNACVPVDLFGAGALTPEAVAFIRVDGVGNPDHSSQHLASIALTGNLFDWSEGTVKASIGAEYRRNSSAAKADPILATGDLYGFASFADAAGSISLYETFGEVVIPLLTDHRFAESVELEAGWRYSHYSTAGGLWTWKAGGQWAPFDGLRLRGIWQRAARAPNVDELFIRPMVLDDEIDSSADFCAASRNPVASGLGDVCIAQGMNPGQLGVYEPQFDTIPLTTTLSGNPDLRPETANTITIGADYAFDTPFSLHVGADYFSIGISDIIYPQLNPFEFCPIFKDAADPACTAIKRDAAGAPIEQKIEPLNAFQLRARGIDASLEFSADVPNEFHLGHSAQFSVRSSATFNFENSFSDPTIGGKFDCAGLFGFACVQTVGSEIDAALTFPKKLITTSFALEEPGWRTNLRWRWSSGLESDVNKIHDFVGEPRQILAVESVHGRHYLDASVAIDILDNIQVSAGVDDILKTSPPLLVQEAQGANTDPGRYNVLGRSFFIGIDARI